MVNKFKPFYKLLAVVMSLVGGKYDVMRCIPPSIFPLQIDANTIVLVPSNSPERRKLQRDAQAIENQRKRRQNPSLFLLEIFVALKSIKADELRQFQLESAKLCFH